MTLQTTIAGQKDYKQTNVGLIPVDWEIKSLSEIATVVRGGSPRPAGDPRYFFGNYIPWLTVAALTNISDSEMYVTETYSFLTEEGSKHSRTLEKGTLIIANSGATLGVAKILGCKCCANDGIAALIDQDSSDKRFVCYYLNSQTKHLRKIVATGNGQPNLNTGLIGKLQMPFPSVLEQKIIADALSDTDTLIRKLQDLIPKKCFIKEGIMQELLTGKRRLPGFNSNWKIQKLGEIVKISKGQMITEKEAIPGNIPVIAGGRKPAYYHNMSNRPGGAVTISASGAGAGFVSFFDYPIFASDCSTIEKDDHYSLEFIYYQLKLNQEKIYAKQSGGAQPHIHADDLYPLLIWNPEKNEQIAIANILLDLDLEIRLLEEKLDKLKLVKEAMMLVLLTGKIRLPKT